MKIGLSLEGGGMRGCVGAGMLAAINHLGLRDAFDVVYGSSAGSLMGAFFLSGQTPLEGPGIYYDILSQAGKDFIDQVRSLPRLSPGLSLPSIPSSLIPSLSAWNTTSARQSLVNEMH